MIWLELSIFLGCIIIGSRLKSIGMGVMGGIGLLIFVFVFKLPPGSPPVTVLGMIIAVITALSAMEAAGGLRYLVSIAEKIMRKNPSRITIVAPFVTYILIFLAGTQHVIYALLPVIAEISRKSGIRPERPISVSEIASMLAIISSPISAVTVAMVGLLSPNGITLTDILMIIIPSSIIALIITIIVMRKRGKELDQDEHYLQLLKSGKIKDLEGSQEELKGKELFNAKGSTLLFLSAVLMVVIIGLFPDLKPTYTYESNGVMHSKQISMAQTIMIMMLAVGGLIMLIFKAEAPKAVASATMKSGIVALISILGISWLGSSFFKGNESDIINSISTIIEGQEWLFGFGLFFLSVLLFSQAATVVTLIPVALALEIPEVLIIALYPTVNGLFFLPTYGTILAAISFDRTGTTKIGKYILNHSFMLPGLISVITAVLVGLLLTSILF